MPRYDIRGYLTHLLLGEADAETLRPNIQTPVLAPARCPQPPPARCGSRTVSQSGVFRPRGFASGQIRNAAPSTGRQAGHSTDGAQLRIVASFVLSSPGTFGRSGLAGLLPQRRGPRQGHKLTSEVMQFVTQTKTADPSQSLKQLARAVKEKFDIVVHPRSITRQWQRQKKKHRKLGFDRPCLCWRPAHHRLRGLAVCIFLVVPGAANQDPV